MIDLTEAGRRLAATRVGPTPPLEQVQARQKKRARHRRVLVAGSVLSSMALAAALVLALLPVGSPTQQVETGPPSPPTSATTPTDVHHPAGSVPIDYQRLRLWLPLGWTTSLSGCHALSEAVFFPSRYAEPGSGCTYEGTDTIVVLPLAGAASPGARTTTVNGFTVAETHDTADSTTWSVPSLGVQMVITGSVAQQVAETLDASPLEHLLTAALPTAIPAGWKTVEYGGFEARVPASWPTYQAVYPPVGKMNLFPSVCSPPVFRAPFVFLGKAPSLFCPLIFQTEEPPVDDGLWLQSSTAASPLTESTGVAPGLQRLTTIGPDQVLIVPGQGDSVQVQVQGSGRRMTAVIGLGEDPTVAETILSSIRPAHS